MTEVAIVNEVIKLLERRYGKATRIGRGQVFTFGDQLTCSVSFSKFINGHKYFFAVNSQIRDVDKPFPNTALGEFIILICGAADCFLVLPRKLILEMLTYVPKGRVDVFYENGAYILQTTKKPRIDVTEFVNALPKPEASSKTGVDSPDEMVDTNRDHVRIQWILIQLGITEGCKVWVPMGDRALGYNGQRFASHTIEKLPNFGFDHKTTRIVQNIDVLWLNRNVIRKAFEIEATTSIYSGLLRLNDLVLAQPNNTIELYISASQSRLAKVHNELIRPTFLSLARHCQFLSFERLDEQWSHVSRLGLLPDQRLTNLIRGERLFVPDHYSG